MSPGADYRNDPNAGFSGTAEGPSTERKAEGVARTAINKHIHDSTGMCWFLTLGRPGGLDLTAETLSAVTGRNWSKEELLECGERIANLERAFNLRHGLTPEDDHSHVSPRLLEIPLLGPGKGKTIAPYLVSMVNEYYRSMGWDEKTGKPLRRTLKRFGLDEVARDLWG
jgi:aldehyde:ferredoxin oxidoreductase